MCQASREAYAREHGLSARTMFVNVQSRRMNAAMHRWQADCHKFIKFEIRCMQEKLERDIVSKVPFKIEPAFIKGYFVEDDWHLSPEESAAVDKAFQTQNNPTIHVAKLPDGKVAMDTENCEHRDICPGPCEYCDDAQARARLVRGVCPRCNVPLPCPYCEDL